MNYENLFQEIAALREQVDCIYIYGFGTWGRGLYQVLKSHGIAVDGFVVSTEVSGMDSYEIPVRLAASCFNKKAGYILALNEKNANEVKAYLEEHHIESDSFIDAGKYIRHGAERHGTYVGSIEVTVAIGCRVNCKYCPQGFLLSKYFENDKNRPSMMSLDTFEKCLRFFPQDYDISFGGMSEPFLNKQLIRMLKMACDAGKNISLFTTLVGASKKQIQEIVSLPLKYVVLHVADRYGYANIPVTEEYLENLELLIKAKKADGMSFVDACNAQTEADMRVKRICAEAGYEILTEMTDRAGILNGTELIHNSVPHGKIRCGQLGEQLNCNILLPDGTVLLCCMDFGMKHVLGNIFENTYEEILSGKEMQRVKAGMAGDEEIDILCRNCSHARQL